LPLVDSRDGHFPPELCFSAKGERFKDVLEGSAAADFIKVLLRPWIYDSG
jgi:hypothetical protein